MGATVRGEPPASSGPRVPRIWRFGSVVFDEAAVALSVAGRAVQIERRPLELLSLLLRHAGEVVTKDEILTALWPDRVASETSLTKCVARLRQALADGDQKLIRTVHGYGYRLIAEIVVEEPAARIRPAAFDFKPGDALPHRPNWRLVERLGTGGFGDAWLGEHAKTRERRVFKFGQDSVRLTALRREITLSRLLREGLGARNDLACVLDWNLEEAPYFIEIDWSAEGNLAEWAERQGGIGTIPLARRLDLVAGIADALAAAHSMGVLHKDLKPANVLVYLDPAGRPRVRLTDFGSGHMLDPGRLDDLGITRPETAQEEEAGSSGGTLLYQAPELIAGQASTVQADIYALGVILYQMVVGDLKRVLAPGWEHGVADPLLREDIAAAAAGDPARRLADAAELARRLRTLDDRRAERESAEAALAAAARTRQALERAQARRAPLLVLVAVLVLGLGASVWLYVRADAAGREARRETARAQTVTKFLTDDLLSAANPFLSADPNITVRDLLATTADGIDHRFQPGSLDRAAIEAAIGNAYAGLSDAGHALPLLKSALATRREALGDGDPETQAVRLDIVRLHDRNADLKAMKEAAQEILDAGKAGGHLDAETELRARYEVAHADCQLQGNDEGCLDPLRSLLAEARTRLGARNELCLALESDLAFSLDTAQRFDEAVPMARDALAGTLEIYGPRHPLVLDRKFKLAEILSEAGQTDEAIALLSQARAALLAISGGENEAAARTANQLAKAYSDAKRYDEALPLFQAALDYHVKSRGEDFDLSRNGMNNVANTLAFLGRTQEAIVLQRKVLDIERRIVGPDQPDSLWYENNLANFYERAGDLANAESTYGDVVRRARGQFTKGEWDLGHFLFHLGAVQAKEGKSEAAHGALVESVAILTAALGKDNVRTRRAQTELDALPVPVTRR